MAVVSCHVCENQCACRFSFQTTSSTTDSTCLIMWSWSTCFVWKKTCSHTGPLLLRLDTPVFLYSLSSLVALITCYFTVVRPRVEPKSKSLNYYTSGFFTETPYKMNCTTITCLILYRKVMASLCESPLQLWNFCLVTVLSRQKQTMHSRGHPASYWTCNNLQFTQLLHSLTQCCNLEESCVDIYVRISKV